VQTVTEANYARQHSAVCDHVITISHSNDYYCSAYAEEGTNSENKQQSFWNFLTLFWYG